jgi:hypothetical protein
MGKGAHRFRHRFTFGFPQSTHTLSYIGSAAGSLHAPHPRHTLAHKALCSPHPASTQVQGMGYTVALEEAPLQPGVGRTPSRSLQHA